MTLSIEELTQAEAPEIATTIRNAGLAGAGGAGFPTYAKWERLDDAPFLLVNHQESEPNYYMDKWLGKTYAEEFAAFFDALLDRTFDVIVVCAKEKDREDWMRPLEAATDATVRMAEELPVEPTEESGVVIAYTDDRYQYGMESVLLRIVADVAMRDDLPMDYGWIVQNTETLFNIYRTLDEGTPVTRKYVHVDGNVPNHRLLDVPVGTTASELLKGAGRPPADLDDGEILADGGPGWCFEIDEGPGEFGVTKRTNCLLVLDEDVATENTLGDDRINVIEAIDWSGDHEREPSTLEPDRVRIPSITNDALEGVVSRSSPIVEEGAEVGEGEIIAVPDGDGICNMQHASVDGVVSSVSETHVEIERSSDVGADAAVGELDHEHMVYWTWCDECGAYVARPELDHLGENATYLCQDCR